MTETSNIASLCAAHHNQLLANGWKEKADCYLGNPSGIMEVTLWENFTTSIQDAKTYTFSKVGVLKEHKSEKLMSGTFPHDCNISESPEFA